MAIANLIEQNRRLEINRAHELERLKTEILAASKSWRPRFSHSPPDDAIKEMSSKLLDWVEQAAVLRREQAIIQSLRFDGMLHRRQEIPNAHKNTFQWVFKPDLHFKEWLETGDGIYWVSGDPGSGKSTLIKYLSTHEVTHQALRKWAGDKVLVTARFFFWFSGTVLQKSQEGLLRSLLFELLRQCPSSIRDACSSRWTTDLTYPWEKDELMDTIKLLRLQLPLARFCFFIDGLDEYRGDPGAENGNNVPQNVSEIIDIMNALSSLTDVKLCISSRPWRAFEKAFGGLDHRKFYVNDENQGDIRLYIQDKFERSTAFTESTCKIEELEKIVDEVVEDSRGVFIWVFLVVESLLRGLSNEDRLVELRHRLSQIPKTLNDLFERMLSSVEDIYQEQAAQILQVALHAVEPLSVMIYSYVGDDEHNALEIETRTWTAEECVALSKTAEVRIKVRCPDLIKIRTPLQAPTTTQMMVEHQVDFLHRTVRDFLALEDTQKLLNQRLKKPFDAAEFICHGFLTQIKGADLFLGSWSAPSRRCRQLLDDIIFYATDLEERTGKPQIQLLDELQRVMTQQTDGNNFLLEGDSFMGIMVRKQLYLYVETKLPQALDSHGVPLLACALWPGKESGYKPPSPKMVSLLLRHGAKSAGDGSRKGTSIWEDYLCWLYKRDTSRVLIQQAREGHIAIIQSLLQYGADPRIRCLIPRKDVGRFELPTVRTALEVIQHVFAPEERVYIDALLNEQQSGFLRVFRWLRRE